MSKLKEFREWCNRYLEKQAIIERRENIKKEKIKQWENKQEKIALALYSDYTQ